MKKNRLLWLMFLLILPVFAFSACNNNAPERLTQDVAATDKTDPLYPPVLYLRMSTGPTSGNYYPFGAALAKAVDESSNYLIIDVLASADTDSAESIGRLANDEAQLALVQNDILSYAYYATDTWQDKPPVTNMAPLMTLYPEICQVVVGANSGLTSLEDLKGRRVAIGEEGTALQASALKILAEYGLGEENIEAMYLDFSEAAQAMRDKTIDAFFVIVGTPNKAMMDLQAEREITVLSLDENVIASLIGKYPFYTTYTMKESDYSFLTQPVNTVALRITLVAASSLSEQAAYDIVKTILKNSDKIAATHAKGMYVNADNATRGLPLELHPGALRYFKEIGILTDPAPQDIPDDEQIESDN